MDILNNKKCDCCMQSTLMSHYDYLYTFSFSLACFKSITVSITDKAKVVSVCVSKRIDTYVVK